VIQLRNIELFSHVYKIAINVQLFTTACEKNKLKSINIKKKCTLNGVNIFLTT